MPLLYLAEDIALRVQCGSPYLAYCNWPFSAGRCLAKNLIW